MTKWTTNFDICVRFVGRELCWVHFDWHFESVALILFALIWACRVKYVFSICAIGRHIIIVDSDSVHFNLNVPQNSIATFSNTQMCWVLIFRTMAIVAVESTITKRFIAVVVFDVVSLWIFAQSEPKHFSIVCCELRLHDKNNVHIVSRPAIEMKSREKVNIIILNFDPENEKSNLLTTRTYLIQYKLIQN